jgi:hypothetical protein
MAGSFYSAEGRDVRSPRSAKLESPGDPLVASRGPIHEVSQGVELLLGLERG